MRDDDGWIQTLMEEAENERMHLMTFIEIAKPTSFERMVILGVQGVFLAGFSVLYLLSSRTAHRVVGYFGEEAVTSYTLYLQKIDEGRSLNVAVPAITPPYWQMADDATLRDVVLVVRADEAHHRDVTHGFQQIGRIAIQHRDHRSLPGSCYGIGDRRLMGVRKGATAELRSTPVMYRRYRLGSTACCALDFGTVTDEPIEAARAIHIGEKAHYRC